MKALSFSGEYDHFMSLETVELRYKNKALEFTVEEVRQSGKNIIIKLEGIETPEKAKQYNNWEIWVPRDQAAQLNSAEYYYADLVGATLMLGDECIGTVLDVWENSTNDLIEVRYNERTILIPFIQEYIGTVDLEKRVIELKTDWILE